MNNLGQGFHDSSIKNRPGEAEEMKKALLCDTLSATTMVHQLKTGIH